MRHHTWIIGHMPREKRIEGGIKGRRAYAFKRRRAFFAEEFDRLTREGQRITKETLLDTFNAIWVRAWGNGYRASEAKWRLRSAKGQVAA